jgi:hypothetical protein
MWKTTKKGIKYLPVGTKVSMDYGSMSDAKEHVIIGYTRNGLVDCPKVEIPLHDGYFVRTKTTYIDGSVRYGHDNLSSLYEHYTPEDLAGIVYNKLLKDGS